MKQVYVYGMVLFFSSIGTVMFCVLSGLAFMDKSFLFVPFMFFTIVGFISVFVAEEISWKLYFSLNKKKKARKVPNNVGEE